MDFELTAEQRELQGLARKVSQEFRKTAEALEASGEFPWENMRRLAELGLLGVTIPEEYGGTGGSLFDAVLVLEQLAQGCYITAMAVLGEIGVQSQILLRLASPTVKDRYLPGVVRGEKILAICISEPEAGSDAGAVSTSARTVDGGYVLNGGKIYISRADVADLFIVFARFDGIEGSKGVGALAVERGMAGFSVGRLDSTLGGEKLGQLFFDECVVPKDNLLVGKDGFRTLMHAFNGQRCLNSAICLGLAQGAFEESIAYAKSRRQFGKSIADFQGVQWMLADMAIDLEAARLLIYRAAGAAKNGLPDIRQAALAKTFANEMAIRVTNQAVQLHGAMGFIRGSYVERAMRGARFGAIGGGTTQIQRNIIARELLRT